MAKKEDVVKGAMGKSKGYKTTKDDSALNKAIMETPLDEPERVEPSQLPIPQISPQPPVMGQNIYERMAEKLQTALGPSNRFENNAAGAIQGLLSGTTPDSAISQGQVLAGQDETALQLAKSIGKPRSESRLKIPAKQFTDLANDLSSLNTNREATKRIRSFLIKRRNSEVRKKLGYLEGLWTNAGQFIRKTMKMQGVDEARAIKDYWVYVNAEIKSITGAQMSEPEARRLMKQMPNWNDRPETIMAVWDDIMQNREKRIFNTYNAYRRGNWQGYEGLTPLYEPLAATPYQRTDWPERPKTVKKSTTKKKTKKKNIDVRRMRQELTEGGL